MLPNEQRAGISYAFIQVFTLRFVEECCLGFLEAVKGIGRGRVFGLVGMDQERYFAVLDLNVRVRDAGLEV